MMNRFEVQALWWRGDNVESSEPVWQPFHHYDTYQDALTAALDLLDQPAPQKGRTFEHIAIVEYENVTHYDGDVNWDDREEIRRWEGNEDAIDEVWSR